jgi:predicted N-acetyltransferase YhbS
VTFSLGEDAPFSVPLYAEAFGIDEAEAKADISTLLSAGGALPFSLSEDGRVLSQGISIPFWADGAVPVSYLYALATDPASRGQGLLRTLIRETADQARRSAYSALCLLPADQALADAYRRMGFTEERPAGAAPTVGGCADLSLRFDRVPDFLPCPIDELRIPFGNALSAGVFAYAFASLGDRVMPCRIGEEHAILSREDPRCAMAVTEGLSSSVRRVSDPRYLLMPLVGALPNEIPEPLPR